MANGHTVCGESLETISVFITELEVIGVHRVLLEADTECVQDGIIVLKCNLIWLLAET